MLNYCLYLALGHGHTYEVKFFQRKRISFYTCNQIRIKVK